MHVITSCDNCDKEFMYNVSVDQHLQVERLENNRIRKEYPIQDEQWPSRRWNKDKTEYEDLSGGYSVICPECYEKIIKGALCL